MTGRTGLFCQFDEDGVCLGAELMRGLLNVLAGFSPSSISLPSRNLFFSSSAMSDGIRGRMEEGIRLSFRMRETGQSRSP